MSFLDKLFGRLTLQRFAQDLIAEAEREGQTGWHFVAEAQELRRQDDEARVSLQNAFREYSRVPAAARKTLIQKFVGMMGGLDKEIPKLWTMAQKAIYPVLRTRKDMLLLEIMSRGQGQPIKPRVEIPWIGGMVIRIAYDSGPATSPIGYDELDTWGVSVDEALKRSLQNLRSLPAPRWAQAAPGVLVLDSDVSYEESMLLREDVVAACQVQGDAVFMPINRGLLLATGTQEPGGIEALLEEAKKSFQNAPWPLSPVMAIRKGQGFEPYSPSGSNLVRLRTLELIDTLANYRDQQKELQEYCERSGIDVYVATADVMRRKDDPDTLQTWTTWTQGVSTWLPAVDLLIFNKQLQGEDFDTLVVPWDKAFEICKHYMKPLAEDPVRFSVDSFPDDADWRRLCECGELVSST